MNAITYIIRGNKIYIIVLSVLLLVINTSCKKQDDWLDKKNNKADFIPTTLKDFQALLDNSDVMNTFYPTIGLLGGDNFYIADVNLASVNEIERRSYNWTKDIYGGIVTIDDWKVPYQVAEYANIVLEGLNKIQVTNSNQSEFNNIRGQALFFRAFAFYNLAQIYCKPFNATTASSDLGIPLRMTTDVNVKSVRSTIAETYERILLDLKESENILSATASYATRPTKIAAQALLAKVYLCMEDYTNANTYANTVLTSYSTLLDYNTRSATPLLTFPNYSTGNPEILFWVQGTNYLSIYPNSSYGFVDSLLYKSYDSNDLRKTLLYKSFSTTDYKFRGSYGFNYIFSGLAINEIYLIRAECYARSGNTSAAMNDLNTLLQKRWITGTFVPYSATNADDALRQILKERRKELPYTGQLRWEDLRRLNKDPRFAIILTRISGGVTYTLPPNDPRYVLPIPDVEIQLSGIQQNPR